MENATSALKIASGMFIFIMALATFFMLVTRIRETSEQILINSDKTNLYNWNESDSPGNVVDENVVIATLYSQDNTGVHVFIIRNGSYIYSDDRSVNIQDFVKNNLNSGKTYIENTIEVNVSGKKQSANDGTVLTIQRRKYRDICFLYADYYINL